VSTTNEKAFKELTLRSLFRPANLLPAVGVAAVGIILGFWPLYLIAAGIYGALAATTFFSRDERRRALAKARGQDVDGGPAPQALATPALRTPGIRQRYDGVHAEETRIRQALASSPVPLPEVDIEIAGLMEDVGRLCSRAQQIVDYLESVDEARIRSQRDRAAAEAETAAPDMAATLRETADALGQQLATIEEMIGQIDRYDAQMLQIESSLGAIRSQVVRMTLEGTPDEGGRILEQVGSARSLVTGITQSMEAVSDRPAPAPPEQGRRRPRGAGG
jgi:hypothetical protein